jgi:DNA ligase-1
MKSKPFAPILAPNQQPVLDELVYPLIASNKIDGLRMIVKDGKLLTRSLKPIMNVNLQNRFKFLAEWSQKNNTILDGELFSPAISFPELSGMCRGFENVLIDDLKFYCFDRIISENFDEPYQRREKGIQPILDLFNPEFVTKVKSYIVINAQEVKDLFEKVIADNFEGLILRSLDGRYKFGRASLKENLMYKCKPFETFDRQITGVVQSTEVDEDAEKKINELGRSVTSKKLSERHTIEKASAFWVDYEGKPLKVVLAMTDPEKVAVWANRASLIGKWIEFKGMKIGMKKGGLPRHPVMIRYREDK